MSISNYASNLEEKSLDNIKTILSIFIKEMFNIKNKENIVMLTLILGFVVMFIISKKDKTLRKNILFWFNTFIASYIIYQISLFIMYIFSMPLYEAQKLASYIRYYRTIILFEYGMFLIAALSFINSAILSLLTLPFS